MKLAVSNYTGTKNSTSYKTTEQTKKTRINLGHPNANADITGWQKLHSGEEDYAATKLCNETKISPPPSYLCRKSSRRTLRQNPKTPQRKTCNNMLSFQKSQSKLD